MSEFRLRRGEWGVWKIQKKEGWFWWTVATSAADMATAIEILNWYRADESEEGQC